MKKAIYSYFLLLMAAAVFAQDKKNNTFQNEDREFNDWSVSAFVGANLIQGADIHSWSPDHFTPGYDLSLEVRKQITHAFGMFIQGNFGKTNQENPNFRLEGETEYIAVALMGDINLSNLLRRRDNKGYFNWALHLYGGMGALGYEASRRDLGRGEEDFTTTADIDLGTRSLFLQGGLGLRYRFSRRFDFELRGMYIYTGDETFDGSGNPDPGRFTTADIEEGRDDAMMTFSLGAHYKFGKHDESLQWFNPIAAPPKVDIPEAFVCVDDDNDGVCDQWDRCLETPEGVRVDGSGCALDSDQDGVVDSEDECPTQKGSPKNRGCPEIVEKEVDIISLKNQIDALLRSVEFNFDSDVIRKVSYEKLNQAAEIIIDNSENYNFLIEGHTDAAGSAKYNQGLSERRAQSVVKYLVNRGVNESKLKGVGKGESELKHVECDPASNCPPWKNLENRRVIIQVLE